MKVLVINRPNVSFVVLHVGMLALFYMYLVDAGSAYVKVFYLSSMLIFSLSSFSLNRSVSRGKAFFLWGTVCWITFGAFAILSNLSFDRIYFFFLEFSLLVSGYSIINKPSYLVVLTRAYYLLLGVLLVACIADYFGVHEFKGAVLGGASENYATSLFLGMALLVLCLRYKWSGRLEVRLLFPAILMSLYLNSRFSAAVSIAAMICYLLLLSYQWCRSIGGVVWFYAVIMMLVSIGGIYFLAVMSAANLSPISGDPRLVIWSDFFRNIDFYGYIQGVDFSNCCRLIHERFANNPHNSLLRSFSVFGLAGGVYLLMLVIGVGAFFVRPKARIYALAFMFWALRGMTDSIATPHYFDIFYFSLYFLIFNGEHRDSESQKVDVVP
ncbi:hypothetical protein MST27_03570 [Pseudomonas sp. PS1]|uniref:Uncharacterized protein n=1 Tax=Stutzerimonas marianensis TaxID=2929513 RepID=A0A9X1W324_9GAMM|nr:hypothetical protein [Pseudomonas marianensis]MCJ0972452.1 hypothetical protein [Pseudomonas marianensis]